MCSRSALAKCGDINRWHWSHAGRRHCDPWQENEGPWHRAWKSLFPLEMQEILHYDKATGEKHIADLKRSDGWVIELQNSPMSIQEMESRESLIIVQPHPQWKNNRVIIKGDGGSLMFWRRSDVRADGSPTHELHSGRSLGDLVTRNYIGHHLCFWQHSREVWLRAKRTVVLDFGSEVMWAICRYGVEQFFCLQKTLKSTLMESLLAGQSLAIGSVTRR
jgi:competence protein CoiA